MIPYEELDKALARWKARSQNAGYDAGHEIDDSGAVPSSTSNGTSGALPAPQDRTGEIDLGDTVIESYEDN